jgi:hypothetical protein
MISMRVYFSTYHLFAASGSAKKAELIEREHTGAPRFDIEHRVLVTQAIICAIAFLEAFINELYTDASEDYLAYLGSMIPLQREHLASVWSAKQGRDLSTLDKCQRALVAAGHPMLARGRQPYQDAALVVGLRNTLIHYRPVTLTAASEIALQRQLRRKFDACRLMAGAGNPWFPDHCLGAGAAQWAVNTVRAFADAISARLGVNPHFQRVAF